VSIPTRRRAPRFQDALGRRADYLSDTQVSVSTVIASEAKQSANVWHEIAAGARALAMTVGIWPSRGESNSRPRGSEPRALSTELRDKYC
jgi:hypothetical protein